MSIPIYLETGRKKTFASALDWPGWSRSGRDEQGAVAALFMAAQRYAAVTSLASVGFHLPGSQAEFEIVARLPGGASIDFGVPEAIPPQDECLLDPAVLRQTQSLLAACWQSLDQARQLAAGKELRKGPRGGGRELDEIARHVFESAGGYLARVGVKVRLDDASNLTEMDRQIRQATAEGLEQAAQSDSPATGPRGGKRWPARYFARRLAWHILDHVWEIEDRI